MKIALPYANVQACIPAMLLVAVNVTNSLGPTVQLAALLVVLAVAFPYLKIERGLSWIGVFYLLACVVAGVMVYGVDQAVIKAGKLVFFVGASLLTVRGAHQGNRLPALIALRAMLVLCAMNSVAAIAMGQSVFRAGILIEFSIYSAYTLAILIYLARPLLRIPDRLFGYGFLALCGSTTGLLVLILAELVGRKLTTRRIIAALLALPIAYVALNYLMEVRGKELTLDYLLTSDRGNLFSTFYQTTVPSFSPSDWLFGLGVGEPLHRFITPDPGFNGYLLRIGEGAVYSFCLHNEALRILCDFGILGLVIVGLRLWKICPWPVLVLLGVGMMTNSYLYSFSGALLASGLFQSKPSPAPVRQTALARRTQPASPTPVSA